MQCFECLQASLGVDDLVDVDGLAVDRTDATRPTAIEAGMITPTDIGGKQENEDQQRARDCEEFFAVFVYEFIHVELRFSICDLRMVETDYGVVRIDSPI